MSLNICSILSIENTTVRLFDWLVQFSVKGTDNEVVKCAPDDLNNVIDLRTLEFEFVDEEARFLGPLKVDKSVFFC